MSKKDEEDQIISANVTAELRDRIDAWGAAKGVRVSRSEAMRALILLGLDAPQRRAPRQARGRS